MKTKVKILRIAAIICCLGWIVGFIGGMIAKNKALIIIGVICYFATPILAYLMGSLLEGGQTGCAAALLSLLLPFVVLPYLIIKVRPSSYTDGEPSIKLSTQWKCPSCGTVLLKSDPLIEQQLRSGAVVTGTVTCGHCLAQYPAREVYTGKYDV